MRKLTFRFQRILDLKERVEDTRRAALGEVVAESERQKQALSLLQRTLVGHGQRTVSRRGGALDATLLRTGHDYSVRLQRDITEQSEKVRQVDLLVEEKQQELLAATKERRVFEILRERAVEAHRYEQRRQERIWLDEVGQRIHARGIAGDGTEHREGLGDN